MFNLFIQNWIDESLVTAIGWTLVHSLWQGLLIALIAAVMFLLNKRSSARLRYNFLVAFFFMFIIISGVTFYIEWQQASHISTSDNIIVAVPVIDISSQPATDISNSTSIFSLDWFNNYVNEYSYFFVTVWFVFFLVKTGRLAASINHTRKIRRINNYGLPSWQKRLRILADRLGIQQQVQVLESTFIKVPVVIGYLKPVILLPFGMMSNLPAGQVEAIILHELAHIRRRDYLVNLLQCFGEAIFFFNPAILWLASKIREERENCCDDIAIHASGNKTTYINALMAFQEAGAHGWFQSSETVVSPAFPGKKYYLLNRVKRIIYNNNKNLNNMEKVFLATGLVVTGLVALSFTSRPSPANDAKMVKTEQINDYSRIPDPVQYQDTVPPKAGTIITFEDGKEYKLVLKNDMLTELYIDGTRIADDKIAEYQPATDRIIAEKKAQAAKAQAEAEKAKQEAMEAKERAQTNKQEMAMARGKAEEARRQELAAKKAEREAKEEKARKAEKEFRYDKKMEIRQEKEFKYDHTEEKNGEMIKQQEFRQEEQKIKQKEMEEKYKDDARRVKEEQREMAHFHKQLQRENRQKRIDFDGERHKIAAEARQRADESKKIARLEKQKGIEQRNNMLDDMVADKLVTSRKDVSIIMNNDELIINGVKQPAEIHQKYVKKYLAGKKGSIRYINQVEQ